MTWLLKQALDQANQTNSIFKCSLGLVIQFQSFWHSPHPSLLHAPLFVQGWGKWDKLTSRCSYFFPFRSNWKNHSSEDLTQKISQESWHYSRPLATNRRGNSLRTTEEFLRALLDKGVKGQHANYGLLFTAAFLFAKHASQVGCYCLQLKSYVCDGFHNQGFWRSRESEKTPVLYLIQVNNHSHYPTKRSEGKQTSYMHINPHHLNN